MMYTNLFIYMFRSTLSGYVAINIINKKLKWQMSYKKNIGMSFCNIEVSDRTFRT